MFQFCRITPREQPFGAPGHVHIHMYFTHSHSLMLHLTACGHPAVCSQYRSERCPVSRHGNCDSLFNVWIPCLLRLCATAANFGDEAQRKGDDGNINLRISLCLHWLTVTDQEFHSYRLNTARSSGRCTWVKCIVLVYCKRNGAQRMQKRCEWTSGKVSLRCAWVLFVEWCCSNNLHLWNNYISL